MAVRFVDGMSYDGASFVSKILYDDMWPNSTGYQSIYSDTPRFTGGRFIKITNNAGSGGAAWFRKTIHPTGINRVLFQCGYRCFDRQGVNQILVLQFYDGVGANTQVYFYDDQTYLKAYNGDNTLLGTASVPCTGNTWCQLEIDITIHASAGSVLLKVDGATAINVSGVKTQKTANASYNSIYWGSRLGSGGLNHVIGFSDIIVMDTDQVGGQNYCNSLLGIRRVQLCQPTADGYYHQYTPSVGSDHYATVDEIPQNETDYNETLTIGNKDTFVVQDVATGAVVDAVIGQMYNKNADAVASSIKGIVRSNSLDGEGTELVVPSSYAFRQSVIYVDPNTGVPFTAAGFNAAEFGYKRSA